MSGHLFNAVTRQQLLSIWLQSIHIVTVTSPPPPPHKKGEHNHIQLHKTIHYVVSGKYQFDRAYAPLLRSPMVLWYKTQYLSFYTFHVMEICPGAVPFAI